MPEEKKNSSSVLKTSELQSQMALRNNVPLHTVIELTSRCNQSCPFCYQEKTDPSLELTTEDWKRVLRELAELGGFSISLSGGEALLRDDLREIVREARRLHFQVRLTSNGQNFDENTAKWMAEEGVVLVQFSLHGPDAATHDRIVDKVGAFENVKRAALAAKAAGIHVKLACVVTSQNYHLVPAVQRTADEWDIFVSFDDQLITPRRYQNARASLAAQESQLKEFFSRTPAICSEFCEYQHRAFNSEAGLCTGGKITCHINERGDVFPCSLWKQKLGNVREQSLVDIWRDSVVAARLRAIKWEQMQTCKQCENWEFCAPCAGLNFDQTGDIFTPAPSVCLRARVRRQLKQNQVDRKSVV